VGSDNFTHILRVLNTNVDGKQKIMYALTAIKGIGRRFSNICCKKAEVDLNKRWVLPAAASSQQQAAKPASSSKQPAASSQQPAASSGATLLRAAGCPGTAGG